MRYVLRTDGYATFKKITRGKKWVGRVYKNADGQYVGKIGHVEFVAATEHAAFEGVVSKNLGYEDVDALRQHNSAVRHSNRVARERANVAFNDMMKGEFDAIFKLLKV